MSSSSESIVVPDASKVNFLEGSVDSLLVNRTDEAYHRRSFAYEIYNVDIIPNVTVVKELVRHSTTCCKPYVKLREYADLPIGDRERDGYLTDRMMEVCSSCLDRTAIPGKFAITTCNLSKKGLQNIEILGYHQYLSHLDLSSNNIESVEVLSNLPFLQCLDVSHNYLTTLFEFKAPLNLSYVNYSYNLIEEIPDLQEFWGLVYLNLSHNLITEIFGLDTLKYLNYLDLCSNKITHLENINNLNIQTLCMECNNISTFEYGESVGLHTCLKLLTISFANNCLESLEFLKGLRNVESIDVSANQVKHLIELTHLENMPYLHKLNLEDNPITANKKYKVMCFKTIERLLELDGEYIDSTEKGTATFMNETTPDKEFEYNNVIIETINQLKTPEINSSVMPCYQTFASMILLVGPMCTKKEEQLTKLFNAYPGFLKRGTCHTTRPPTSSEIEGREYYFVTEAEFKQLLLDGKLLCCSHKYGHSYGLCCDEIKKISEDIGILLINCDITSALQIRAKFLNCKLVLSLPHSEKTHIKYLEQKFVGTPWIQSFIKGYLIDYKPSRSGMSDKVSDIGNAKAEDLSGKEYFSTIPVQPILKTDSKKKRDQSVSFHHYFSRRASGSGSRHSTNSSEGYPTSVSQALLPGSSKVYPLSSISTTLHPSQRRQDSISSDTSGGSTDDNFPTSASKALLEHSPGALSSLSKGELSDVKRDTLSFEFVTETLNLAEERQKNKLPYNTSDEIHPELARSSVRNTDDFLPSRKSRKSLREEMAALKNKFVVNSRSTVQILRESEIEKQRGQLASKLFASTSSLQLNSNLSSYGISSEYMSDRIEKKRKGSVTEELASYRSKILVDVSSEEMAEIRPTRARSTQVGMSTMNLNTEMDPDYPLITSISEVITSKDDYILSVLMSRSTVSPVSAMDYRRDFDKRISTDSELTVHNESLLMEYFIETQMMRRRLYLNIYEKNPGLFFTIVHSDQENASFDKLKGVLKTCVDMQHKHIYIRKTQCKNTFICDEMREAKLKKIVEMIR